MTQNILVIGATSAIAGAVARIFAREGARMFLVARNAEKLAVVASDLAARGAIEIQTFVMDANSSEFWSTMASQAWGHYGAIDVALVAHGTLPDQTRCQDDLPYALQEFRTNGESIIACLTVLAQHFEMQAHGTIAVIGSVAGDRGRASNYLYGSAKAAVEAFASGLRGRMDKSNVGVLTIKPGFVDTPMTQGLSLPAALLASADKVAISIHRAIKTRRNVLYTPWIWQIIMLIIKLIPNRIFKKMKL